jgi:branched-chain amino acid transport system permease protein
MEFASLTVSGILAASFLALGAIGLTLTFGIARFANIAHTDYMTLGAYGVFLFNGPLHQPLWISVILGLAAAILLGVASASLAFDCATPSSSSSAEHSANSICLLNARSFGVRSG